MKIVFLGLPLAALFLLRDGHDIGLACISREDGVGLRRLRKELGADRVLLKPRLDAELIARVRSAQPDLVVSWYWTNRIPMELVRVAKEGGFGVHPSLLPRHRGPDPTTWAILSGDRQTGVTAHRLEKDYDTGAILKQEHLTIDSEWDSFTLARALDRPGLRVLRAVAADFARGTPPPSVGQRIEDATDAPFPSDEQMAIRWSAPTEDVLRQIRAFAPAPGASTEVFGRVLVILSARAASAPQALEEPGEAVVVSGRTLIRTLDGAVEVRRAEVDGHEVSLEALSAIFEGPLVG